MSKSLLDDPIKKPGLTFWILTITIILSTIVGLVLAYPKIFPNSGSELAIFNVKEAPSLFVAEADQPVTSNTQQESLELINFSDSISGFNLKIPLNWRVTSSTGLISINSDVCGTSSAILYPVKLVDQSLTANQFLTKFTTGITKTFSANQNIINIGNVNEENQSSANAIFTGETCDQEIKGSISASVSEGKGLIRMSWAPTAIFSEFDNTLKEVLRGYRLTGAAEFLKISGSKFKIGSPASWNIIENEQNIIAQTNNARVLATTLPLEANDTPDLAIDNLLLLEQEAGYEMIDLAVVKNDSIQTVIDELEWTIHYRQIEFTNNDLRWSAVVTSATNTKMNGAILSLRQSQINNSNNLELQLLAIEKSIMIGPENEILGNDKAVSIPISFIQEGESVLSKQSVVTDIQANEWQNTILGFQLVENNQGQFLAPLSSQLPSGQFKNSTGDLFSSVEN